MLEFIEVSAEEMPSKLFGTDVSSFEMAEFRGADIIALGAATTDKTLTERTIIFYNVLAACIQDPVVVDHLTANDVWYLALLQWKRTNRALIIRSQCTFPVYSVVNDTEQKTLYTAADVEDGDTVVSVDPCNGWASTHLNFDDIIIARCDKEVFDTKPYDFVHLPYANQLEGSSSLETKAEYLGLWIDDLENRSLPEVSKCCTWIQAMQHGVIAQHLVRCSTCGRTHNTAWALSVESFTL